MIAEYEKTLTEGSGPTATCSGRRGALGQVLYLESEAWGLRGTGIGCYFDDQVHRLLGFRDETFQSLYHFSVVRPLDDDRLTTLPPYRHLGARPP